MIPRNFYALYVALVLWICTVHAAVYFHETSFQSSGSPTTIRGVITSGSHMTVNIECTDNCPVESYGNLWCLFRTKSSLSRDCTWDNCANVYYNYDDRTSMTVSQTMSGVQLQCVAPKSLQTFTWYTVGFSYGRDVTCPNVNTYVIPSIPQVRNLKTSNTVPNEVRVDFTPPHIFSHGEGTYYCNISIEQELGDSPGSFVLLKPSWQGSLSHTFSNLVVKGVHDYFTVTVTTLYYIFGKYVAGEPVHGTVDVYGHLKSVANLEVTAVEFDSFTLQFQYTSSVLYDKDILGFVVQTDAGTLPTQYHLVEVGTSSPYSVSISVPRPSSDLEALFELNASVRVFPCAGNGPPPSVAELRQLNADTFRVSGKSVVDCASAASASSSKSRIQGQGVIRFELASSLCSPACNLQGGVCTAPCGREFCECKCYRGWGESPLDPQCNDFSYYYLKNLARAELSFLLGNSSKAEQQVAVLISVVNDNLRRNEAACLWNITSNLPENICSLSTFIAEASSILNVDIKGDFPPGVLLRKVRSIENAETEVFTLSSKTTVDNEINDLTELKEIAQEIEQSSQSFSEDALISNLASSSDDIQSALLSLQQQKTQLSTSALRKSVETAWSAVQEDFSQIQKVEGQCKSAFHHALYFQKSYVAQEKEKYDEAKDNAVLDDILSAFKFLVDILGACFDFATAAVNPEGAVSAVGSIAEGIEGLVKTVQNGNHEVTAAKEHYEEARERLQDMDQTSAQLNVFFQSIHHIIKADLSHLSDSEAVSSAQSLVEVLNFNALLTAMNGFLCDVPKGPMSEEVVSTISAAKASLKTYQQGVISIMKTLQKLSSDLTKYHSEGHIAKLQNDVQNMISDDSSTAKTAEKRAGLEKEQNAVMLNTLRAYAARSMIKAEEDVVSLTLTNGFKTSAISSTFMSSSLSETLDNFVTETKDAMSSNSLDDETKKTQLFKVPPEVEDEVLNALFSNESVSLNFALTNDNSGIHSIRLVRLAPLLIPTEHTQCALMHTSWQLYFRITHSGPGAITTQSGKTINLLFHEEHLFQHSSKGQVTPLIVDSTDALPPITGKFAVRMQCDSSDVITHFRKTGAHLYFKVDYAFKISDGDAFDSLDDPLQGVSTKIIVGSGLVKDLVKEDEQLEEEGSHSNQLQCSYESNDKPREFQPLQRVLANNQVSYAALSKALLSQPCDIPCSNLHGICMADSSGKSHRCNCKPGYGGHDCSVDLVAACNRRGNATSTRCPQTFRADPMKEELSIIESSINDVFKVSNGILEDVQVIRKVMTRRSILSSVSEGNEGVERLVDVDPAGTGIEERQAGSENGSTDIGHMMTAVWIIVGIMSVVAVTAMTVSIFVVKKYMKERHSAEGKRKGRRPTTFSKSVELEVPPQSIS